MDPIVTELSTALENVKKRTRAAIERLGDAGVRWSPGVPETNSAAQLVAHMCGGEAGTIHQYIGGTDVHRDRDAEFNSPPSTAKDLIALIDRVDAATKKVMARQTGQSLGRKVPTRVPGVTRTARDSIIGVLTHQSEHLGHIELTEQLWKARK